MAKKKDEKTLVVDVRVAGGTAVSEKDGIGQLVNSTVGDVDFTKHPLAEIPYPITQELEVLPNIKYVRFPTEHVVDSSWYSWNMQTQLATQVLQTNDRLNEEDRRNHAGSVLFYGTDTGKRMGSIIGYQGVELLKKPVVLITAINDAYAYGTDAVKNAVAGVLYAAYGNKSGVHTPRTIDEKSYMVSYRVDSGGSANNRHARNDGFQAPPVYLATVDLKKFWNSSIDQFGDENLNLEQILKTFINEKAQYEDGYLDTGDQRQYGARGTVPNVTVLGARNK